MAENQPNQPKGIATQFNPYDSQNLFRQKLIEVNRRLPNPLVGPNPGTPFNYSALPTANFGPREILGRWYFAPDEYMAQQFIQRIDFKGAFNEQWTPTGWERSPSGAQVLPGYYSGYLNIMRNKEYIIQDMPLFLLDGLSPNQVFRNFYPFQVDFHDSFVNIAAFHQPLQVQNGYNPLRDDFFQTVEQDLSLLFNFSYIPTDVEFKDAQKPIQTGHKVNPYNDRNGLRVKFIEIPINPNNYFGKHYFPVDRVLDTAWIHRIVSIDPFGLLKRSGVNNNVGPNVPLPASVFGFNTTAAGAISPSGRAMLWGNRSLYVNIVSRSTNIQERIPLASIREKNISMGFRNFVPFQIDLQRSYIEIPPNQPALIADPAPGQDPTDINQPECCIMLGIYYYPSEIANEFLGKK